MQEQAHFNNEMEPSYRFYVLDSQELVEKIEKKLGNPFEVFKCNAMRRRNNTNGRLEVTKSRTLIGATDSVIENFKKKYPEYIDSLKDYNWDTFHRPNLTDGETFHLHVSGFPGNMTADERKEYIQNRLLSILSPSDYTLSFPIKDRQIGTLQSYVKITFKDSVSEKVRFYAKVLLNHEEVKKIPSSYLFSLTSSEEISEKSLKDISEHFSSLFSSLSSSLSKQFHLSIVPGSSILFSLHFHSLLPENVRRAMKNLICQQPIYQIHLSNDEKISSDCYITAIWYNINKILHPSKGYRSIYASPMIGNVPIIAPSSSFNQKSLDRYQPLLLPPRIKQTEKKII